LNTWKRDKEERQRRIQITHPGSKLRDPIRSGSLKDDWGGMYVTSKHSVQGEKRRRKFHNSGTQGKQGKEKRKETMSRIREIVMKGMNTQVIERSGIPLCP